MNYQGRLLNAAGAVVADGKYNVEFKVYQDGPGNVAGDTGGTLKWTEDYVYATNAPDSRVTVKNGYFSVTLGSICPLAGGTCTASTGNAQSNTGIDFNQDTLWLSVNIGNTTTAATFAGASADGEMLPMRRLAANPYALNSGKLGGITAAGFLQIGVAAAQGDASSNTSLFLNKTAVGNILDLQRGGADVILTNTSGQTLFRPTVDSLTALQVQKAGTSTVVFTVDSTNSRIGIGTGAPAYAVDAVGSINASIDLKVAGTTVCTSAGCTPTTTSTAYIQNQNAGAQASSNFNISGSGTAATSFISPSYTGSGAVALNSGAATPLSVDSGTTGALNIGTSTNAKTITIGNATGATQIIHNSGTSGVVFNQVAGSSAGISVTSGTNIPTGDQLNITNAGSTGVTTAGVNGLSVNYKGGAAAVESAAARLDLQPGTTSGGTWSALRLVPNATGAVAGVNEYGVKIDNLTTPGAGTESAIYVGTGWDNVIQSANFNVAQNGAVTGLSFAGTHTGNGAGLTSLDAGNISAGTLSVARGGTGAGTTPTNGQLLIGNGTNYTVGTLGATGLTVTPGVGTLALAVNYGAGANNAAAGANTFTCTSGTGNLSGGGTVVTIGTSGTTCGALNTVASPTFTSATLNGGGQDLTLSGATSNYINYGTNGAAAPTFTTRSVGTKIVLYDQLGAAAADYGIGIEGSTLWNSVPSTAQQFKWYGGTTQAALLSGSGNLTLGTGAGTLTSGAINGQTLSSAASLTGTLAVAGNVTQTAGSTFSAGTGFKINGAAASSGTYLRGDGTNFVASAIQSADIPSGSNNYIQNQTGSAQAAGFNINGAGTIGSLTASNGFIGINGTNPALNLNANTIQLAAATAGGSYSTSAATGDVILRNVTANGNLIFQQGAGSAQLFIQGTNGNVGIGNASPGYKLTVSGYAYAYDLVLGNNFNFLAQVTADSSVQGSLRFATTHTGSGNQYTYQKISTAAAGYTIAAGDSVEYDVYCSTANVSSVCDAGVDITFSDATALRSFANNDQNGLGYATSISAYASGRWYHRKVSLGGVAGKIFSNFDLVEESDIAGSFTNYYRKIILTNGSTLKYTFWDSGIPSVNTTDLCASCSNPTVTGSYFTDASFAGTVNVTNEVQSVLGANAGQFRAIGGGYGAFTRNDGADTYTLLTASGSPYGSYNALRPFAINNASGNVTVGNGALYVQHGGNTGIGTSGPNFKLDVQGGDVNVSSLYRVAAAGSPGGVGLRMAYAASTPSAGPSIQFGDGTFTNNLGLYVGSGIIFQGNAGNPDFRVFTPTTNGTAGTETVRLGGGSTTSNSFFNAGSVGIGNISPSYKLDVSGDIRATGAVYANANGTKYFQGGDDAALYDVNVANTVGIYGIQDATKGCVQLGNNTSANVCGSGGNVGVGTNVPTAKLNVGVANGATAFSSVFQANSGSLGTTAGNELNLGTFGGTVDSNGVGLGVHLYRNVTGSGGWTQSSLLLGMDVDASFRAGGGYIAIGSNGTIGINTNTPTVALDVQGSIRATNSLFTNGSARIDSSGNLTNIGNVNFTGANPTFTTAGSYIQVPNGLYVSGGTTYLQNTAQIRGGIANDTAATLSINGGTSGYTNISGTVRIGDGTAPAARLDVVGGDVAFHYSYGLKALDNTYSNILTTGFNGTNDYVSLYTPGSGAGNANAKITMLTNGNVGVGTIAPVTTLDINGSVLARGSNYANQQGSYIGWNKSGGTGETNFVNHRGGGAGAFFFDITADGSTFSRVARIDSGGTFHSASNVYTNAPDYAETILASDDSAAADVVIADPVNTERVMKASSAYSSAVVGIVSSGGAGVLIDHPEYYKTYTDQVGGNGGIPIALAGRVPVHVTNENGPIKPGDYLTSSSTPGYAMKATQAGATIGKAYEFFNAPKGSVLVLVNISYYNPTAGENIQAQTAKIDNLTANMADVSNLNVGSGATIATLHITGDATFDKNVSVAATLTTLDLAVNGHIITEGNTPTTTVLVAAGPNATVSITGNDISGTITITTGDQAVAATKTAQATSGPTAGELAKVIFDKPYGKIPHILLAPSDQTSAGLAPYPGSRAIDSFTLGLKTIPQPNTIYSFEYFITQ